MDQELTVNTFYGPVRQQVLAQAEQIKLVICDVDGVLSDGLIYMGNNGEELKTFNVRDGYGIRCLLTSGVEVAIITGRSSTIVADRANTLGIRHVYQGQSDKLIVYQQLIETLKLQSHQVAYIGDDLIDWPVMEKTGLSVAVADAHPLLLQRAHYITQVAGGRGAVRELCDLILMAQNKLESAQGLSI